MTTPSAERYLRTEFLRALAHAIRSPLGVLEGVLGELHEAEREDHPMLLAMAERNLARLFVLGQRLDWVAELEEGARGLEIEACNAARAVEEALGELRVSGDAVEVRIAPDRELRADRTWLRRTLQLLIENALRFARSRVAVSLDDVGGGPAIVVQDDGPGIDHARLEALFDRYRSGRARGADQDLALGLSLARDYARGMGGDLAVSADSSGTRCVLSLPAATGKGGLR